MSYKDMAQLTSLVLAQKVEMGEGSESCAELVVYSVHVSKGKSVIHSSSLYTRRHVSAFMCLCCCRWLSG